MAKALRFVGTGSLFTVGAATLVVAAYTLRTARRYVGLVEDRMEHLREEQAGLLGFLREERRVSKEESKREREQRLEIQQKVEWLNREFKQLQREQGQLAEKFERERARRLEYQQQQARQEREERERERERRDSEQKIEHLKRELRELREARQDRKIEQDSSPPVPAGPSEGLPDGGELPGEEPLPARRTQETERTPRPASSPGKNASRPAKVQPTNKRPRLGVRLPHPDDVADGGRATVERTQSGTPVEVFRKHYDRYLENYRGYVELAEGLYQARDDGEMPPGSFEEREWQERMRRAKDGIERTTSRLDMLEEHNPELATDDRVSHRASVARRHSELERRTGAA